MDRPRISATWKYTPENFAELVAESHSWADLLEKTGHRRNGNSRVLKLRISEEEIDVAHFTHKGIHKGGIKTPLEEVLVENRQTGSDKLKKRLLRQNILKKRCALCDIGSKWNGKQLVLQLDHISGDHSDNRIENLRILCPNCHSQTPTFCSKKLKKPPNKCVDCGVDIKRNSTRCVTCHPKNGRHRHYENTGCIDCGKDKSNYRNQRCKECYSLQRRKVRERPPLEQLMEEVKELGYCGTGRKYGVSDNAIRKWIKTMRKE